MKIDKIILLTMLVFFVIILNSEAQSRRIHVKKFWSYATKSATLLNDTTLCINEIVTLEEKYFGLTITSVRVLNKRFLKLDGFTCKDEMINCPSVPGLMIFTANKKGECLTDTTNLHVKKKLRIGSKQSFKIRLDILNCNFLYIYAPGFLLNEFDIRQFREELRQ